MLNRRGLLSLIAGSMAAPAIGAKTAASILGVSTDLVGPMPVEGSSAAVGAIEPAGWWGSAAQIAMDARIQSHWESEQARYSHMKSWGPAFKRSIIARELQAENLLRRKLERDQDLLERVLAGLI